MENKYRVSQHVWDRLNAIFWSSEVCQQILRILRKNVFCSIKLLFKPFLWTAKRPMEFLGNFFQKFYVVIYLVNCLKLEKSGFKIHFHFLQFTKKAQKAILWSRIHFFCKRSSLRSQTFLSVSQTCLDTLYLCISWCDIWTCLKLFRWADKYLFSECDKKSCISNMLQTYDFLMVPFYCSKIHTIYILNFRDFCPPKADEFPSKHRSILREQKIDERCQNSNETSRGLYQFTLNIWILAPKKCVKMHTQ